MHCEKCDAPAVPQDLLKKIYEFAHAKYRIGDLLQGRRFEAKAIDTVLDFYMLPPGLEREFFNFANQDPELSSYSTVYIQIIHKGTEVPPFLEGHGLEDTRCFLIKAGGPAVKTCWWKLKEEYKDTKLPEGEEVDDTSILELVECHVLEENNWYKMNCAEPRGYEGLENVRFSITLRNY